MFPTKFALICPNGSLNFNRSELENNENIKDTVMQKTFFSSGEKTFTPGTEINLMWDIEVAKQLLPFIRQGIIYLCYKNNTARLELSYLLEFLAGDNKFWLDRAKCLRKGVMDRFGSEIGRRFILVDQNLIPLDEVQQKKIETDIIKLVESKLTEELEPLPIDEIELRKSGRFILPFIDDISIIKREKGSVSVLAHKKTPFNDESWWNVKDEKIFVNVIISDDSFVVVKQDSPFVQNKIILS